MLYSVLGLSDPYDIELIEADRSDTENMLLYDTGAISVNSNSVLTVERYWPGKVDATGVRVKLTMGAVDTTTGTLTSPYGTTWSFPITTTSETTYENRTAFLNEPAGGRWTLTVAEAGALSTTTRFKLLVSNNVDSGQIYNFFAFRDPVLPGTPDISEAQRLFSRSALGHMTSYVVQSIAFLCDSPYSLMDRDPLGE